MIDLGIKDLMNKSNSEKETIILQQLNELLLARVLILHSTQPVLTLSEDGTTMIMSQAVRLTFEGAERLHELKRENEKLHAVAEAAKHAEKILHLEFDGTRDSNYGDFLKNFNSLFIALKFWRGES